MIILQISLCVVIFTNVVYMKPAVQKNEELVCSNDYCRGLPNAHGKLNIHLAPHSHDDVGWLKTVDQYYYGSRSNIQRAGVQYILDSVVAELRGNTNRTFIIVETAFFWKWWQEQSEDVKEVLKSKVASRQVVMTGGAWSMNDEAVAHYQSIIDQFAWGLRRLNDIFGVCGRPTIGWQIDPFGHSREMASIFAQLGFDGLFFARLDNQDKDKRQNEKSLELLWRGSDNLGESSDLLSSVLYRHYSPPPGFCFDVNCGDDPINDDPNSPDNNVEERVRTFVEYCQNMAKSYKSNHILLTMGDDFHYQAAGMWYTNLDKLIRYVNERYGDEVFALYSTPSCYLQRLHEANETWPTKSDDFFPYGSDSHSYWTGYFTSRPTTKFLERQGNNILQVCKQVSAITDQGETDDLIALREAMGVFQHHDAITGTEKQAVTFDYVRLLSKAIGQCEKVIANSLSTLLSSNAPTKLPKLDLKQCSLNISVCDVSESSQKFATVIYNPSSQYIDKYIRLPVTGESYSVKDNEGNAIENQIVPIPDGVLNIPGRNSPAKNELVFLAERLPPLGYQVYQITKEERSKLSYISRRVNDHSIGNEHFKITLDHDNGHKVHMRTKTENLDISQEFLYYLGVDRDGEAKSGAYIFRPDSDAVPLSVTSSIVLKGPLVEEIHQSTDTWIHSINRVYKKLNYTEVDWIVGPISIDDNKGKEIISRYKTNLKSNSIFYTDSNGRELIRRERNKRGTWDFDVQEPISSNYYPITSRIVLTENDTRFAVLTDRAQGGSSLVDGEVELMVHRRLLHDDGYGVGEALNETSYETEHGSNGLVARGTHYVFSGKSTGPESPEAAVEESQLAAQLILAPSVFLANTDNINFEDLSKVKFAELSAINDPETFPSNVQILTLEPWKDGTVLLRLEHILDKDDDPNLSLPACVNIENLFKQFRIVKLEEETLDGNQLLKDKNRYKWNSEGFNDENVNRSFGKYSRSYKCDNSKQSQFDIVLNPMEIRTFVVNISTHD